ncbi:unnamed protein product [Bemisia tabaci]|uniref:Uncharacterized protein n=1 Tax=Bemisia tabaci TaxID=7038 RepID=A0A9P0A997_BEMTA|nr:unnamed protein product [Bemisia tabaci]
MAPEPLDISEHDLLFKATNLSKLASIDLSQEDRSRVEIFAEYCAKKREPVCGQFLNLLNGSDGFIVNMRGLLFVGRCLQVVLRHDKYRLAFIKVEGPPTLLKVLASGQVNFQIQYQLIFCLWLLTFNPKFAQKMNRLGVIPILGDILSDFVTEKVTRIILAVFRKSRTLQTNIVSQWYRERKFDDEDIVEDIQFLNKKLQASVQDLREYLGCQLEKEQGSTTTAAKSAAGVFAGSSHGSPTRSDSSFDNRLPCAAEEFLPEVDTCSGHGNPSSFDYLSVPSCVPEEFLIEVDTHLFQGDIAEGEGNDSDFQLHLSGESAEENQRQCEFAQGRTASTRPSAYFKAI